MKRLLLYVHYNKFNQISEHVLYQLEKMRPLFRKVIFISNSKISKDQEDGLKKELVDEVLLRKNIGFDFAAWRDGMNSVGFEELKKYDYRVTELILSKKGIKSIEYSYVTNKILLYYDVKLISEKQILDWLNKVWKTMINHSELYENKSLKEIEDNLDTFYNIIKEL